MEEEKFIHPLEGQNQIERLIQLEGSKDPENFIMPNKRTLKQVREDLEKSHQKEFQDETEMMRDSTRKMSAPGLAKGKDLVMTSAGSIIDVTPGSIPERSDKNKESKATGGPGAIGGIGTTGTTRGPGTSTDSGGTTGTNTTSDQGGTGTTGTGQ